MKTKLACGVAAATLLTLAARNAHAYSYDWRQVSLPSGAGYCLDPGVDLGHTQWVKPLAVDAQFCIEHGGHEGKMERALAA